MENEYFKIKLKLFKGKILTLNLKMQDCSDNSDEENCIPQSINNPTERSLPSHPEEKYLG